MKNFSVLSLVLSFLAVIPSQTVQAHELEGNRYFHCLAKSTDSKGQYFGVFFLDQARNSGSSRFFTWPLGLDGDRPPNDLVIAMNCQRQAGAPAELGDISHEGREYLWKCTAKIRQWNYVNMYFYAHGDHVMVSAYDLGGIAPRELRSARCH